MRSLRTTVWFLWIAMDSSMLSALHMDRMMEEVEAWRQDPRAFMASRRGAGHLLPPAVDQQVFVLIIEGFLIFNYRPLNELMNRRYFLQIPYKTCKQRRSSRVYTPPDPQGYFDRHVWPMYLKNRQEMEEMVEDLVLLDGLSERDELLSSVLRDVTADIEALRQR
ncbi:nicotinamide riboside kinase 1 isoform X2 [Clupea harengus]|uniref:Nicotinamide riboside kinase 1 isoform X2 n=1 Tax=Clupea harengus TaxID=7950 RepID=A0A8M1KKD5_CLUHA|nr:nicotinamide riboside kinase 1 isoform X2 [Clupea harengus]